MNLTASDLFIELLHRLRMFDRKTKYSDAMLLYYLLRMGADGDSEYKTTSTKVWWDGLAGYIDKNDFQSSTKRLEELGFITVRIHANYKTHFTVHRAAVLQLLSTPELPSRLPGVDDRNFPFLDAWREAKKQSVPTEALTQ